MSRAMTSNRLVWLVTGLVGGLVLGGFWPQTPLHATATDRFETFAVATGALDEDVEAVYLLDCLTGDLRAVALGKQNGKFTAFFSYSYVMRDLGVDPARNPRFLMVTGMADLRRSGGARLQPSRAVLYVAEVTTGVIAAYAVPWSPGMHAAGQVIHQSFVPLDVTQFRAPTGAPTVPAPK